MRTFLKISLILQILLMPALAQELVKKELNLRTLQLIFNEETAKLDSLEIEFEKFNREIENARKSPSSDEKVRELLAAAVVISNEIDDKKERITVINSDIEAAKVELDKIYSQKIDSLRMIQSNSSEDKKLDIEVMRLSEKRILVRPKVFEFSFNLKNILDYSVDSLSASESEILGEYIRNALSEIDSHLVSVRTLNGKIDELIELEEGVEEFIEESNASSGIMIMRGEALENQAMSDDFSNRLGAGFEEYDMTKNEMIIFPHIRSYSHLINSVNSRLNFSGGVEIKLNDSGENYELSEYSQILKGVVDQLEVYKKLLLQKAEYQK